MNEFFIGQKVNVTRSFTLEEVNIFSALIGDDNPIHIDQVFTENSIFKRPIVHGLLVSSLFLALIASKLPGKGAIYLGQNLKFKSPVFHDDEVTAEVEIISLRKDKNIMELSTKCWGTNDTLLIEGVAVVKF